MEKTNTDFIAYEYKEIMVDSDKASTWMDAFENFGWGLNERQNLGADSKAPGAKAKTILHFKRNRKIVNKAELTRLQRNFEASMNEIDALEKSKTSKATIYSLATGFVGCAFMAGSVFAITAASPFYVLSVILAVPGMLAWVMAYFIYKRIVTKQTIKVNEIIEQKYDEIYEICEKGNQLTN